MLELMEIIRKLYDGDHYWCGVCQKFIHHNDTKCRCGECWHYNEAAVCAGSLWQATLPDSLADKLYVLAGPV